MLQFIIDHPILCAYLYGYVVSYLAFLDGEELRAARRTTDRVLVELIGTAIVALVWPVVLPALLVRRVIHGG